jgi:solute carrier family 35 protein
MASVRGVNLPMYTTLRRTTAAFTMTAEYFLAGKRQPWEIVASVGLMAGAYTRPLLSST